MSPSEKKKVVENFKTLDNNAWGITCCRELLDEPKIITLFDIPLLQSVLFLTMNNPSHLDRGLPEDKGDPVPHPNKNGAMYYARLSLSTFTARRVVVACVFEEGKVVTGYAYAFR